VPLRVSQYSSTRLPLRLTSLAPQLHGTHGRSRVLIIAAVVAQLPAVHEQAIAC
jgi:hypothetical protein